MRSIYLSIGFLILYPMICCQCLPNSDRCLSNLILTGDCLTHFEHLWIYSGRLFHLWTTSYVEKYLALSKLTLWTHNLRPLTRVDSCGEFINKLSHNTLLNPFWILKHSISLLLSSLFENIWSSLIFLHRSYKGERERE